MPTTKTGTGTTTTPTTDTLLITRVFTPRLRHQSCSWWLPTSANCAKGASKAHSNCKHELELTVPACSGDAMLYQQSVSLSVNASDSLSFRRAVNHAVGWAVRQFD